MAFINLRAREIQIKIVYYGPAHSGKTANLRRIYALYRNRLQSRLLTVTAGDERTIFLDFMTFTVPRINGFDLKVRIYTVPGHEPCAEIRKTVLKGADGIVFVADLSAMRKTNIMSLIDLRSNLRVPRQRPRTDPAGLPAQQVRPRRTGNAPAARGDAALRPERRIPTPVFRRQRGQGQERGLDAEEDHHHHHGRSRKALPRGDLI